MNTSGVMAMMGRMIDVKKIFVILTALLLLLCSSDKALPERVDNGDTVMIKQKGRGD